jgi:hypothetical protein
MTTKGNPEPKRRINKKSNGPRPDLAALRAIKAAASRRVTQMRREWLSDIK